MEDDKPSIEDIMLAWKRKYGVSRTSERGKQYTEISRHDREEHFHYLYATLKSYGYTSKEMTKPQVCYMLAELCWSDEIQKLSNSIVERKRKEEIKTWKGIVLEEQINFIEEALTKRVEEDSYPTKEYKEPEEVFDLIYALKPVTYIKDDPKYNTLTPIQVNEDLMAKLNAVKTSLKGKNE